MVYTAATPPRFVNWASLLDAERPPGKKYVLIGGMPVEEAVYNYIVAKLKAAMERYPEEVYKQVATIVSVSMRMLATARTMEFHEFGDYAFLESEFDEMLYYYKYEPGMVRPRIVTLYGPPGTGKTTWGRVLALRKLTNEEGVLTGLYLEVSASDLASKWAGVPINTFRTILDMAAGLKRPTILVFDEADALFRRPAGSGDGVAIEQYRLVGEAKARLSAILSQKTPLFIVLTTNHKDVLAHSDAAIGDRISAWIHVPHPPINVRLEILENRLHKHLSRLYRYYMPSSDILISFASTPRGLYMKSRKESAPRIYIYLLPHEADYIAGILSAWGWNPLNNRLYFSFKDAYQLWRRDNPIFEPYSKVLHSLIEVYMEHMSQFHATPKSFLRTLPLVDQALHNLAPVLEDTHTYFNMAAYSDSRIREGKASKDSPTLREKRLKLSGSILEPHEGVANVFTKVMMHSLGTRPVSPALLLTLVAKKTSNVEFIRIVNDIQSLTYFIVRGIRGVLGPYLLVPRDGDDATRTLKLFRETVERYSAIVERELREGRVLEPLRIMYTEPNLGEAWRRAVEKASALPRHQARWVKMALIPLKLLHPAIHAPPGEKGPILYRLAKDQEQLDAALRSVAEELGVEVPALRQAWYPEGLWIRRDEKGRFLADYASTSLYQVSLLKYCTNYTLNPAKTIKRTILPACTRAFNTS